MVTSAKSRTGHGGLPDPPSHLQECRSGDRPWRRCPARSLGCRDRRSPKAKRSGGTWLSTSRRRGRSHPARHRGTAPHGSTWRAGGTSPRAQSQRTARPRAPSPASQPSLLHGETVEVSDGHTSSADLCVTADSKTWLGFLAKERSLVWALLTRRIRLKGSPKLLVAFGKCFPF